MADYIYLLQNRLTPAQWRALEAVREAARAQSMPVFLVGGAVRDLTTGSPVRDLDFAVQGDARALLGDLEAKGAAVVGEHPVLASLFLTFRGGVRAEIGPTLSVTYPKPGQPETQPAVILDDLRRRDFTTNAMAISLNEGSYGLLLDPLNGTADIENRELRLVSAYGFIEQPGLLLRAARLGERLGWSLEERTQSRYETSKEEGHIGALPEADRSYELEEIFHEDDPLTILEHLTTEGWRDVLLPTLRAADGDRGALDEVRDLASQLEGQGLHPDPSAVFFPLVTAKMSDENRTALKALFLRKGFVGQIESLETRAKELAGQLTSKAAALPSDAWRLIMQADPEVVLHLAYYSRSAAVQAKIKAFLKEWPGMRAKIPYTLMQEMRITPDLPVYDKLLDDLFFALMDGKLDTVEATRAFLEPFSPPAPPQVSVRRRPAKAARTRGKRGAGAAASEKVERVDTTDDEDDDPDTVRRDDDEEHEDARVDVDADADDDTDAEDESGNQSEAEPAVTSASEPDDEAIAKKRSASEKTAKPAKAVAPVKVAAKAVAKAVAEPPPVAPKKAAKVEEPTPVAPAKAKVAPVVVVVKSPAKKTAPVKVAAKAAAPAKTAAKLPAKAVPAPGAAKKTVIVVKQPTKQVPVKAAAKKQPEKASSKAVTKQSAPVTSAKGAKKVAAKGRSGR